MYDHEAERCFVGCLVSGNGDAFETCQPVADHFTDQLALMIFTAASELRSAGRPISGPTVIHRIGLKGAELVGGIHAVSDVCNYVAPDLAGHFFAQIDGKLTLRRGYQLGQWAQTMAGKTSDPSEYANELRSRAASIESTSECENELPKALAAFEEKLGRMEQGKPQNGLQTSLGAWNRLFGGVLEGQMYGLAGRPGTGKTAAMEQIICDYLVKNTPVCVFERDMSPQKLIERMACRLVGVPYWTVARGLAGKENIAKLRDAIYVLSGMPLLLHNPTGLTPERMCAIARRDIRTKAAECVMLDHIQTFGTGDNIREKLTSASLLIRDLVNTTNVPAIVLAHINRTGAKGRPTPEDIKEFDQLYGDADGMLMLWSDKDRTELKNGELLEVNFYGAKNRDAAVIEEQMLFKGDVMKFVEKQ